MVLLNRPVCVAGAGFVGTVTAAGLAELGCTVRLYDASPQRLAAFDAGVPFAEPGLAETLRKHRARRRIEFTGDVAQAVASAGLVAICIEPGANADGSPDLRELLSFADALASANSAAVGCVAVRSTVPPGTCDRIAALLGHRSPVIAAPEFLRKGSALDDFLTPDRTIAGGDDIEALAAYAALFEPVGATLMFTSARNAELIKWASNAFLAMKVTFANEIANLCDALGADAGDVLRGVGYDRRIGSDYLAPGIGFGGPSLERNVRFLHQAAERSHVPCRLAEAVLEANAEQPRRVVSMVAGELGRLRGARIAVWGLAFKAGTDDVSSSPALRVVDELVTHGAAVTAYDPAVRAPVLPAGAAYAPSALDALAGADALLVLTEWPEFARIVPAAIAHALTGTLVIDGRNLLDAERISSAGLRYRSVGRFAEAGSAALSVAI